jgi:hypothetical protein
MALSQASTAGSRHRGPSLLAVAIVFTTLFVGSLILSTAMGRGAHFPSPFQPEAVSNAYFSQHADAVGWALSFNSVPPSRSASSRRRP